MRSFIMKKLLTLLALMVFTASVYAQIEGMPFGDLPPAELGKCYAKCKIADQYETVSMQKLVAPERQESKLIPAVYETVTETILVKEAGEKLVPVAPVYETVTEQIMVQPESKKVKLIPARYKTETRRVLVSEARGQWVKKKKDPNCFSSNPEDCYVACYEEVPAVYRTEKYQVLASAATTSETVTPAKYQTVTKRVLKTPATVTRVAIEPVYKTITKKVMTKPETYETITIPAKYDTVTERRLVRKGGYTQWTEILCAAQTTNATVVRVQKALNAAGYDAGTVDGVLGIKTQTALKQYQTDKGLPIGNLNIETLKSLGVQ